MGGSPSKTIAGLAGFVALGLSPSFVDWQTEPRRRGQIVLFYAVAIILLYLGLFH